MKKVLAVFDFDRTVTDRDSFNDFLISEFGFWHFLGRMLRNYRIFPMALKGDNTGVKNYMLNAFFCGMGKEEFVSACRRYSLYRLPRIVRREAMERIRWHQRQGHAVVIVTASLEEWIDPWAMENGIRTVLASRMQYAGGTAAGKLSGGSCYGKEKVRRLLERYPDRCGYVLYAYGDSRGDREMLEFADYGYYRRFR